MKKALAPEAVPHENFPASRHQKSSAGFLPQSFYVRYSVVCMVPIPGASMLSLYQKAKGKSSAILPVGFGGQHHQRFRFVRHPGSLRFSYTIIIHIGALDFCSKVSTGHRTAFCSVPWCPAVPSSRPPACHGSLAFLYTIIIHIGALDFRRKVSRLQMWASPRPSYWMRRVKPSPPYSAFL